MILKILYKNIILGLWYYIYNNGNKYICNYINYILFVLLTL